MDTKEIHTNFAVIASAFREYVREKAIKAGSTIVYLKDGKLVEEDPATSAVKVINQNIYSIK